MVLWDFIVVENVSSVYIVSVCVKSTPYVKSARVQASEVNSGGLGRIMGMGWLLVQPEPGYICQ